MYIFMFNNSMYMRAHTHVCVSRYVMAHTPVVGNTRSPRLSRALSRSLNFAPPVVGNTSSTRP